MPYINEIRRREVLRCPDCGSITRASGAATIGELTYMIYVTVTEWLSWIRGVGGDRPATYADYDQAIGALECAKLELYRRKVAPYEDRKIAENGDVG